MIYVYGIVDAETSGEDLPEGIDGAPVRYVTRDDLGVACSDCARLPDATEDALWRHEGVLERLLQAGAVLPARFGTVFEDESRLTEVLDSRASDLRRRLERLRNRVELSVRIIDPSGDGQPGEAPSGGPGRRYLMEKLGPQVSESTKASLKKMHEQLVALAEDATARVEAVPHPMLVGAYLVGREAVEPFAARVQELERARPGLTLTCTGPWPPYNFGDGGVSS